VLVRVGERRGYRAARAGEASRRERASEKKEGKRRARRASDSDGRRGLTQPRALRAALQSWRVCTTKLDCSI